MRISRFFAWALSAVCALMLLLPGPVLASSSSSLKASSLVDVEDLNFAGQDLQTKEFVGEKFNGVDFSGADLRGVVFNGSSLQGANLSGVDFTDGIAYTSSFRDANLRGAIFNSALLLQSYFPNADVTDADFTFAVVDRVQLGVLCENASGTNPVTGVDTRDSLGCADDVEFVD